MHSIRRSCSSSLRSASGSNKSRTRRTKHCKYRTSRSLPLNTTFLHHAEHNIPMQLPLSQLPLLHLLLPLRKRPCCPSIIRSCLTQCRLLLTCCLPPPSRSPITYCTELMRRRRHRHRRLLHPHVRRALVSLAATTRTTPRCWRHQTPVHSQPCCHPCCFRRCHQEQRRLRRCSSRQPPHCSKAHQICCRAGSNHPVPSGSIHRAHRSRVCSQCRRQRPRSQRKRLLLLRRT